MYGDRQALGTPCDYLKKLLTFPAGRLKPACFPMLYVLIHSVTMDNISFLTKVSTATGTDIETTKKLIQGLALAISDKVAQGDKVVVPGLGEFSSAIVHTHLHEDVATGRIMRMPESQQVTFIASATLKKRLQ